jgi:hypothetical protein
MEDVLPKADKHDIRWIPDLGMLLRAPRNANAELKDSIVHGGKY